MNLFHWLDDSVALRLVQALLHFLWQGCAVALVVVLAGRTLKRASAQVRYSFDVAAMLVMVACLPVTFALVDVPRQAEPGLHPLARPAALSSAGRSAAGRPHAAIGSSAVVSQGEAAAGPPLQRDVGWWPSWRSRPWSWLAPFAPYVMAGYFLGVALMALRLTLALQGGRRLSRSAIPVEDERLLALIDREIWRMGVKVAPAVSYCERISVPIVVGLLKPAILLPAALATGLSPDQLQALLAHELAHIRQFDLVVNLLQRLAEAVLFFHPAVWFVSRRVSTEREIAADDLVLAAGWPRVHYADALVRMAELSLALRRTAIVEPGVGLAAWGSDESEFKRRVLRLLAGDERPMLRLGRVGWSLFLVVLILVALTPLLVQAWAPAPGVPRGEEPRDRPSAERSGADDSRSARAEPQGKVPGPDAGAAGAEPPPPASSPNTPETTAEAKTPHIILSEHVILWDNKIVTWDEVVERLREIRKSGPFRATFSSTNGLSGRKDGWQVYHDRVMKLYRELFEPVGVSFASISPRGSARYDAIRTADDLRPDPTRARLGQVITPQGEAARAAQVIVLPTGGPLALLDVALSGTQMRDPFDEQWSPTDERGHFVVHPKDDDYLLMILHPSGFALQAGAPKDEVIRLQPWATLTFNSTGDVADQDAAVGIRPTGVKPGEPGLRVYSIETKGKPVEVKVPAGEIALSRSLKMGQGTSIGLPVEKFPLRPGEARALEIKPPSEADRNRARALYEQLHRP